MLAAMVNTTMFGLDESVSDSAPALRHTSIRLSVGLPQPRFRFAHMGPEARMAHSVLEGKMSILSSIEFLGL